MTQTPDDMPAEASSQCLAPLRQLAGWTAAALASLVTVMLVVGDLTNRTQRHWWSAHALTTDTVAGLLVLLVTVLVVNQLISRGQSRQRRRAVAAHAAILVAQARRTAAAVVAAVGQAGADAGASLEFRTYMMMLLVAAPVLLDEPTGRHFLEQAQRTGGVLGQTLVGTGAPPADFSAQVQRQNDEVQRLVSSGGPLLRWISPQARAALERI